jgi:hypothetical protein
MRYRVEYLTETTEEGSVCHVTDAEGDLDSVEFMARLRGADAAALFGASGFQIRDVDNRDRIVALQTFDNPLERFWPLGGEKVVH